jgi:nicotinate-nucleotide pyrophosphorylase (carboxylating)
LTSSLLKAERTALNFLQHLCGIATCTRQFVQKIDGTPARMTDTRKTTPGLRILEKQAVRDGGGFPHRFNLGTAAMLKDNHIIAAGGIGPAVRLLKQHVSHTVKVEVEIDHLHQLAEALEAGADIILLDNMTPDQVTTAVNQIAGKAITEASGGICLETVRSYALTGVQYLSTSQLTVGAKAIDIGLDF